MRLDFHMQMEVPRREAADPLVPLPFEHHRGAALDAGGHPRHFADRPTGETATAAVAAGGGEPRPLPGAALAGPGEDHVAVTLHPLAGAGAGDALHAGVHRLLAAAAATGTGLVPPDAHLHLLPLERLHEGEPHPGVEVGAAIGLLARPPGRGLRSGDSALRRPAEDLVERPFPAHRLAAEVEAGEAVARGGGLRRGRLPFPAAVVLGAPTGVGEHLEGLPHLAETLPDDPVVRVHIGMEPPRQPAVRLPDARGVGGRFDSENPVEVPARRRRRRRVLAVRHAPLAGAPGAETVGRTRPQLSPTTSASMMSSADAAPFPLPGLPEPEEEGGGGGGGLLPSAFCW